ncbi:uncharacterized protein LOC120626371 [Pararge aegeria]|uniref:Jg10080 protein n=1 Tax=Pararge aegeria aegeria TaxID=348720 RepID=A0A8S4SE94_9NEOP|nr:uncharacterized protein LOC120626371 [Pararge aegeria]CAH2265541.1 jg10080 [Pararge aegeria aegeria]
MRLVIVLALTFLQPGKPDLLRDSVHVTSAAARPNNELWCYKCRAEVPDDKCADLRQNSSSLIHKCMNEKRICMVKRFSYTTSTENSTTALTMWALERNCTKNCEPGCIVIGERTKLYSCTSCCATSLCNYGSGAERPCTGARAISVLFLQLYVFLS